MSRPREPLAAEPPRVRWAPLGLLLLLTAGVPTASQADLTAFLHGTERDAAPCHLESVSTSRPGGEAATPVAIGIRVLDLIRVDDADQTLTLDFVVFARWKEPRLGRDVGADGPCTLPLSRVWNPSVALVGERNIRPEFSDLVVVRADGTISYMQRFIGSLRSTADLRDFPMDERELEIRIVSVGYSPDEVAFVLDEQRTGLLPNPSVTDWILGDEYATVESYAFDDGRQSLASIRYAIPARRRAAALAGRLGLPALLIVLMSWIPFWISAEAIGPRLSLAALSMLNAIAFQLVLRDMLPLVPYLTRADWIASTAIVLIFAALVESAVAGILHMRGRGELALRIDAVSRVAAPVTAIGLLVLILAV